MQITSYGPNWTIYKYKLPLDDEVTIQLPKSFKLLKVGTQGTDIVLWALVSTKAEMEDKTFRIIGTGHPIPDMDYVKYIDTVFQGGYVWHIFERVPHDYPGPGRPYHYNDR